ncbi:unnamed protein product [Diatraea saccharalis]|uniref:C2H2-type domain-containing protein n=1 Tax=Diatraea saccharalis TaxID=40085 RepID=A0A9N9R6F1_9NEOP|nr:unnamed protein product [Diatraea saccharalis]
MTETNTTGPIFVDVEQGQYSMQSGNFRVYSHLPKQHPAKKLKHDRSETKAATPNMQIVSVSSIEYQFPVTENSKTGYIVETNENACIQGIQENVTESQTHYMNTVELDEQLIDKEQSNNMQSTQEVYNDGDGSQINVPELVEKKSIFSCTEQIDGTPCSYNTTMEDRLIRHIRKVHRGENPFQCTMCSYSTYNKPLFEEHVRIHQGFKPFKCRFCPYRSASKKNAKKHEAIHRPDNPLKCKQCDFIAKHERSLQSHSQTHSGHLKCPKCDFKAKDSASLSGHKQQAHKKYACDMCEARFVELNALSLHKKKRRVCKECDTVICRKQNYRIHMMAVHKQANGGDQLFVCNICHWSSTVKSRILLHLIHHPNQKVDENLVDISILKTYGIMK